MKYLPTWNSINNHTVPEWFKEAKFGIYTHWGIYCVPACRPNGTWYAYNMYREGTEQYKHHVQKYGDPSKFGYKDFIPMFTGEKFDPDEWAEIFCKAGAKFAGPVGEHHDGFTLWDTKYNTWNSVNMGPKRNVTGELAKAIRAKDMRFMVALHHAENWYFYPHWKKEYDTADPKYSNFYGDIHNADLDLSVPGADLWENQDKPDKKFLDKWLAKIYELIDDYQPDMLWFDFGLKYINENYKKEFLAYYYNAAEKWKKEVAVTFKFKDMVPGSGIIDIELGRLNELSHNMWITDTTLDDGEGWGYLFDARYKSSSSLIHYLTDNVSKNGYLLLNVGPKPNGEIPDEAKKILNDMGKWLEINGEAIYGTTPWFTYGEGPTKMEEAGPFNEQVLAYTAKDIRFTSKNDDLYAVCLGKPKGEIVVESLKYAYPDEIVNVSMLGIDGKLPWTVTNHGLKVAVPERLPCEHAVTLKITRKKPF